MPSSRARRSVPGRGERSVSRGGWRAPFPRAGAACPPHQRRQPARTAGRVLVGELREVDQAAAAPVGPVPARAVRVLLGRLPEEDVEQADRHLESAPRDPCRAEPGYRDQRDPMGGAGVPGNRPPANLQRQIGEAESHLPVLAEEALWQASIRSVVGAGGVTSPSLTTGTRPATSG